MEVCGPTNSVADKHRCTKRHRSCRKQQCLQGYEAVQAPEFVALNPKSKPAATSATW